MLFVPELRSCDLWLWEVFPPQCLRGVVVVVGGYSVPPRVRPSSLFLGLLFAPAVALPCTCSCHSGWCGVGPPGRRYKPLSFRCLADESCGGPAAPHTRHVPPHTAVRSFIDGSLRSASDWRLFISQHELRTDWMQQIQRVRLVERVQSTTSAWTGALHDGVGGSMRLDWVCPARWFLWSHCSLKSWWPGSSFCKEQPASYKPDSWFLADMTELLAKSYEPPFFPSITNKSLKLPPPPLITSTSPIFL